MPPTGPPLTLLIKHNLDAPVYILPPSTRPDSCNRHRKVSNTLPEPDRSRPTRTAIPLLFPIGHIPFFSGLLGLVPCTSAFPCSSVRSHRTLGALQSRSLQPPNVLCSPSRLARRTSRNTLPICNVSAPCCTHGIASHCHGGIVHSYSTCYRLLPREIPLHGVVSFIQNKYINWI